MSVSLVKGGHAAPMVAVMGTQWPGHGATTHAIDGEWSYTRDNRTVCGRVPTAVHHLQSGRPIDITCRACTAALSKGGA